jgi:hypothetical protein
MGKKIAGSGELCPVGKNLKLRRTHLEYKDTNLRYQLGQVRGEVEGPTADLVTGARERLNRLLAEAVEEGTIDSAEAEARIADLEQHENDWKTMQEERLTAALAANNAAITATGEFLGRVCVSSCPGVYDIFPSYDPTTHWACGSETLIEEVGSAKRSGQLGPEWQP